MNVVGRISLSKLEDTGRRRVRGVQYAAQCEYDSW
jgi:hypothetical protein